MKLTLAEAAHSLGVHRRTVQRWVEREGLPAYRFLGRVHVESTELEVWRKEMTKPMRKQLHKRLP